MTGHRLRRPDATHTGRNENSGILPGGQLPSGSSVSSPLMVTTDYEENNAISDQIWMDRCGQNGWATMGITNAAGGRRPASFPCR